MTLGASQVRDVRDSHVDGSHGFFSLWIGMSDKQDTVVSLCNVQTQKFTDKVDFQSVSFWIGTSSSLQIDFTKYLSEGSTWLNG
jgi:hypothetical protein